MKVCEPAKKHTHMHRHKIFKEKKPTSKIEETMFMSSFLLLSTHKYRWKAVRESFLHFYIFFFRTYPNKYIATEKKNEKKAIDVHINMCVCKFFSEIHLLLKTWIYINVAKKIEGANFRYKSKMEKNDELTSTNQKMKKSFRSKFKMLVYVCVCVCDEKKEDKCMSALNSK